MKIDFDVLVGQHIRRASAQIMPLHWMKLKVRASGKGKECV